MSRLNTREMKVLGGGEFKRARGRVATGVRAGYAIEFDGLAAGWFLSRSGGDSAARGG